VLRTGYPFYSSRSGRRDPFTREPLDGETGPGTFHTAPDYDSRMYQYKQGFNDRAGYSLACVLDGTCGVDYAAQVKGGTRHRYEEWSEESEVVDHTRRRKLDKLRSEGLRA